MRRPPFLIMPLVLLLLACGCSQEPREAPRAQAGEPEERSLTLTFNGGPKGGTFNYFANKMASLISDEVGWLDIQTKSSGGSVDNLLALCSGRADMAIVYAGDAFLGRIGKLHCPETKYVNARALAFLYGAPAQLVVRRDAAINTVLDLRGKVVAVGNPGSGAAVSAERFFKHLDLWKHIDHRPLGYSEAAGDFADGTVDAFWVLVGYPNAAVIEASTRTPIKILDLHDAATVSGFYQLYPFYTQATIPEGTYEGQQTPVHTFQDSALWCARAGIDGNAVYRSLGAVFSEDRLADLRRTHRAAWEMSLENGIRNLSIPLHPGAIRFWSGHDLDIPPILMP
ncbi:MAG: TAXI family TRAP transporter solute-binding subunit [Pseudodesulfovibrio sp.]|uniref:TAXI family TRAP transporter solute-binding subunit n=1 Tax=Pseudodesulfovibrio sp. TaxID=2035812 RepID=UPI003D0E3887